MPLQKSKKILVYLFLFLIIGTLNNKNLANLELIKISEIKVEGLDEKNNLKLKNDLKFLKFDNLLLGTVAKPYLKLFTEFGLTPLIPTLTFGRLLLEL